MTGANVVNPPMSVIVKLGSIARHAQEFLSPDGRPVDADAIRSLLTDPEVVEWMAEADKMAFLPVMR